MTKYTVIKKRFELIECLNCGKLKGLTAFGYTVLFHRPCRVPEYDMHRVKYFIAPPGFVSGFMRSDAIMDDLLLGECFRIARIDEKSFMEAWRDAEPGKVALTPDPYTERILVQRHTNILGAELRYALDEGRLYYAESSGEDRFDSRFEAALHLLGCMELAKERKGFEGVEFS